MYNGDLMDPIRHGLFAWKLSATRSLVGRFPPQMIPAAIGLALLATDHLWAGLLLVAGILGCIVALAGFYWPEARPMPRLLSVFSFGVAANVAVVHAILRVAYGHEDHLWEPTRRAPIAG